MNFKLLITFFFASGLTISSAQTILKGKVVSRETEAGIPGAQVILRYKNPSGLSQTKLKSCDENGYYELPIEISLPIFLTVEASANGYKSSIEKDQAIDTLIIPDVKLHEESSMQKKILQEVLIPIAEETEQRINSRLQETDRSSEYLEVLKEQQIETRLLKDSLYQLLELVENKEISNLKLKYRLSQLQNSLTEKETKFMELEKKVYRAYMNIVRCYCEAYTDNSITIGFDITDENGHELEPSVEKFKMYVYKLENSTKKNEKGKFQPLIYSETRQSYMEQPVDLPSERLKFIFKTPEKEFGKQENGNYSIRIFIDGHNKIMSLLEIATLKYDCFVRNKYEIEEIVNNRETVVKKQIAVTNNNIIIEVSDFKSQDGDIVSLRLNNNWLKENYELTTEILEIPVSLSQNENFLIFQAENEGKQPPNTARIAVVSDGVKQEIKLESTTKKSEVLKITLDN